MPNNEETTAMIQDCWRELGILHRSAAELSKACAASTDLLAHGAFIDALPLPANPPDRTWRQKAKEAREIAHRLTVAHGKRQLLEVADSYERLAD